MEHFFSGLISGFTLGIACYTFYLIIIRNKEYNFKIEIVKGLKTEILRTEDKKLIQQNIKFLQIIKNNTSLEYLKNEISLVIELAQLKYINL